MRSVDLVSPEKAGRRVVYLNNPGRRDVSAAVGWLYSGLQVMHPGELASAHAHSASALRFIMEGSGAFTVVDGHKMTLGANDFVLTPNGTWHEHGVSSDGTTCIWQDGLDIPLVNAMEAGFYAVHPDLNQVVTHPVDDSTATWAGTALRPQTGAWSKPYSPLFKYEWGPTYEALLRYSKVTDGSPYDGILMHYVNPLTGGPVMPTMGASMQLLRPGEKTKAHRHTGSFLYQVRQGQRPLGDRRQALRLDRARHLLRAVLGPARTRQRVRHRRRLPVLLQRPAGDERPRPVPRRGACRKRRSSARRAVTTSPPPRSPDPFLENPMRLVTYRRDVCAAARLGALVETAVVDLALLAESVGKQLPATMLEFIDLGPQAVKSTRKLLDSFEGDWPVGTALPLQNVKLLAPIPRPRKNIFGIGLNYVEHVAESSRTLDTDKELPKQPVIFSKPPTTVIGPGDAIEHNQAITKQLDWEVELAVIIGTQARRVTTADALSHVFGYSVMIDMSARDCRRAGQWIYSKGQDTYAPFGPCIVTADEIPDPQTLDLSLTVNGVDQAELEHAPHAVQGERADRRHQRRHHARAGRHHRHRHARKASVPAAARRSGSGPAM